MKNIYYTLLILCFEGFLSFNVSAQIRWDSVPGKFQWPNAANVMYTDSNYIYVAGAYNEIGGKHMQGISRWNGIKWDSLGLGIDGLAGYAVNNQYPNNTLAMTTYQNKLCVGGVFESLGNVDAPCIGLWDGNAWSAMPIKPIKSNYDNFVSALAVISGKLYAGGRFDTVAGQPGIFGITCWDGTKWNNLNFPNYGPLFEAIDAICAYNGSIYVGGTFYDSTLTDSTANILRYDGSQWHAVGGGIKGGADEVYSMVVYNGELYVAGLFAKSDGNADNNIERWDGTKWSDVGGGTDNEIFNLMVYNGKLYAMGEVETAGGISASRIAEWDGSKWCSLGSTFDYAIGTSCIYKDSLYIGGGFRTIDNEPISYIAEWTGGDYTANCSPAGVSEVKGESEEVKVYPNPSSGVFQLEIANEKFEINNKIEVYNVLGQQVYQSNINSDNTEINLSNRPNGVYLYRLMSEPGGLVGQGKLVIEK